MNRRDFLRIAGICGLGLGLPIDILASGQPERQQYTSSDRSWEDMFRMEFADTLGDSEGFAFHCSNCQGNCAWRTFSKDGMIVREEQLSEYPQINPHIPDANPRGCNKGAIHSQAMYEKDRILYPLKRTGERGSRKWERISWEQAISEISEKLIESISEHGPGSILFYTGTGILSQGKRAGGFTSPLYNDKPYHSFEDQVYLKRPYPTVSGRQQFYIDQEVFLRLNSPVPTGRRPLYPSRFPLKFYSPHTRWGIHSTWRSNKYMLRLQRGAPHISLSLTDAESRGIKDGDRVRIWNNIGEFYSIAKVSPTIQTGTIMMDHAWEPHQFSKRKGMNEPVAGLLSPLELAGGWGHLRFGPQWDGNQLAYESTVQVEKA